MNNIFNSIYRSINYLEFAYIFKEKNYNISSKSNSTLIKNIYLNKIYSIKFLNEIKNSLNNHFNANDVCLKKLVKENIETLYSVDSYYGNKAKNEFLAIQTQKNFKQIIKKFSENMYGYLLFTNTFRQFDNYFIYGYLGIEQFNTASAKNKKEYNDIIDNIVQSYQGNFSKIYESILDSILIRDVKDAYILEINNMQQKIESQNPDFDDIRIDFRNFEKNIRTEYLKIYMFFYEMHITWMHTIYDLYKDHIKNELSNLINVGEVSETDVLQNPLDLLTENINALERGNTPG